MACRKGRKSREVCISLIPTIVGIKRTGQEGRQEGRREEGRAGGEAPGKVRR